jgi:phenylpropionate dioxygenase-like ring-hydroxylating dioxygenase large terminal subunit
LPGFRREEFNLKPVRIETLADRFVFFNLDAGAEPLAVQAPGLADELRAEIPQFDRLTLGEGTFTAPIRANWKAALDNYLECYHCAGAHPALGELLDLSSFRVAVHPGWMSHKADLGHHDNPAYPVSAQAVNTGARFWWLWPTTTFNVLPGSPEVSVSSFLPVTAGTALQWGNRFGLPDAPIDAARERYRNGLLTDEDIAIVESVQRGLASRGYQAGRFVVDANDGELSEIAVHHFHKMIAAALAV